MSGQGLFIHSHRYCSYPYPPAAVSVGVTVAPSVPSRLRWPVQVQCMKQGTQSWCSGTTQRGRVGRDMGRGETHEYLCLINVDVWQKSSQYYKVIILQLKLIFLKRLQDIRQTYKTQLYFYTLVIRNFKFKKGIIFITSAQKE